MPANPTILKKAKLTARQDTDNDRLPDLETLGAFHLGKKTPEISVGADVEFPIGKKLFHLVINPGTSQFPTVDLELVHGTNYEKRKWDTTFGSEIAIGKTGPPF